MGTSLEPETWRDLVLWVGRVCTFWYYSRKSFLSHVRQLLMIAITRWTSFIPYDLPLLLGLPYHNKGLSSTSPLAKPANRRPS